MATMAPVEVTVHIAAAPADVFGYFTDPARYVRWMGSEAKLEPEPGGLYRVQMADGMKATGTFLQVESPHLVVFSWVSLTRRPPGTPCTTGARRPAATRCRRVARGSR